MQPIHDRRHATGNVTLDKAFNALCNPLRRRILVELKEDNPLGESDLHADGLRPPGPGGRTVTIELQHNHLPYLAEAGFIDWERGEDRIARGDHFEELLPLLELLDDHKAELPGSWP